MKKENNRWWACTHGELLEMVGVVGGGAWHAMTSVPEPEAGEFMSDRREWIQSRERAEAHRCLKTTVRRQDSSTRKPRGPPREDMETVSATAGSFTWRQKGHISWSWQAEESQ